MLHFNSASTLYVNSSSLCFQWSSKHFSSFITRNIPFPKLQFSGKIHTHKLTDRQVENQIKRVHTGNPDKFLTAAVTPAQSFPWQTGQSKLYSGALYLENSSAIPVNIPTVPFFPMNEKFSTKAHSTNKSVVSGIK